MNANAVMRMRPERWLRKNHDDDDEEESRASESVRGARENMDFFKVNPEAESDVRYKFWIQKNERRKKVDDK